MLIFLKEVASCLKIHFTYNRYYCVTCVLSKRDKFSLKNIGKRVAPGNGRRKPPSYKKLGGSREYPVSWFQLGSSGNGSFDQQAGSRHQSMIENALQTSIESLLWSNDIDGLADCPIEITQVELSSNFHSATVYWKLDEWKGNWSEGDVEHLLSENIEFIRRMLPAFHSMTKTPSVSFTKCRTSMKDTALAEAFSKIRNHTDNN